MATNISRVTILATKEAVWKALTDPELVKLWQYGSELSTDWQVGSAIRFRAEWEGQVFEQWGTVLDVVPNARLRYNLFAPRPDLEDKPENYFEMAYVLTGQGDSTQLEIRQIDNRPGATQEEDQGDENPVLKSLKELVESS